MNIAKTKTSVSRKLGALNSQLRRLSSHLALTLVLSLLINLSLPLITSLGTIRFLGRVQGVLELYQPAEDEFLYQTGEESTFIAKFGDKENKSQHRVRLEKGEHAFELSFLPDGLGQEPSLEATTIIETPAPSPTPPIATPEASFSALLDSSPSAKLASASGQLSPEASDFVKGIKTQIKEISEFASELSTQIEEIKDEASQITQEIKEVTDETRLSYEADRVLVKNSQIVSGVDIVNRAIQDGLEAKVVIRDRLQLQKLLSGDLLKLEFSLKLDQLVPTRDQKGQWHLRSPSNNEDVFTFLNPTLEDGAGASASAELRVINLNHESEETEELTLSIIASSHWLKSEERVFPVSLTHQVKVHKPNLELESSRILSRPQTPSLKIVRSVPEDYPMEDNFFWETRLSPLHGIVLHQFDQLDKRGAVKIVQRDGWFVKMFLQGSQVENLNIVGNQIQWLAKPGLVSRYTSLPDQLKADYLVASRDVLVGENQNELRFDLSFNGQPPDPEDEYTVHKGGGFLKPVQNEDGTISWQTEGEEEMVRSPLPLIKDLEGKEVIGRYLLEKTGQGEALLAIKIPTDFLSQAVYPITIDPTQIDADVESWGLNWGYGRSIIRLKSHTLIACWADNAVSVVICRASQSHGDLWGAEKNPSSRYAADRPAIYADQSDRNVFHLVARELTSAFNYDIYYYKGTVSGNAITFSSGVILEYTNKGQGASIITDTENNRPAVVWRFPQASKSAIRFLRCDAGASNCDSAITNWCGADGTSCGTAGQSTTDAGSADEIDTYPGNTGMIPTLTQLPGTSTFTDPTSVKWDDSGVFSTLSNAYDNNPGTTSSINGLSSTQDYLYVGYSSSTFAKTHLDITNTNSNAATLNADYYNGSWTSFGTVWDGTMPSSTASFASDGAVATRVSDTGTGVPSDWTTTTVDSVSAYWIRFRPSSDFDASVSIAEVDLATNYANDLYLGWGVDAEDTFYYQTASWDGTDDWNWHLENSASPSEDSSLSTMTNGYLSVASVRDETNNSIYFSFLDEAGTNDNQKVYERDTALTRTDRGTPFTDSRDYNTTVALAVDSGTIYMIYNPGPATDYGVSIKTNSSGTSWSAEQEIDDGGTEANATAHVNAPPAITNNRLDLLWRTGNDPWYAEFSSWHTTETRAVSAQSSLPTDDSISLTDADDFTFDEDDYQDTNTSDDLYDSGATADSSSGYLVYYFKDSNNNNTRALNPRWEGQFDQACSGSYPAKLQVYNRNTSAWVDVDSSTTCSADTDFTLSGTISTNLSYYYGTDTYIGSNSVAFRVYKQANGVGSVSGQTDLFSQTHELFTYPGTFMTHDDSWLGNYTWNGRNFIRTANNKLVNCYTLDVGFYNIECRASADDGATWGTAATISSYNPTLAIYQDQTDGDKFHLATVRSAAGELYGDLFYYEGTLSGTTISFSGGLKLDDAGGVAFPSIITDTVNNRPEIIWANGGAARSVVRFFRCDAGASDCATATTNWCNAAGTSCGTIPTTESLDGDADVLVTDPANTSFVPTLAEMPGSGTRSNDLYAWWTRDDDLDLEYNYADYDDGTDWTWQTAADEDSTLSDGTGMINQLSVARDTTNNKLYVLYADQNGANADLDVFERDTSNTKTSRGTVVSDGEEAAVFAFLSVYSGTIFAQYVPGNSDGTWVDDVLYFKINSSGTSWSSALTFGKGEYTYGDAVETGTTKIPFSYGFGSWEGNDAFGHRAFIWHTDETRAVSTQSSLPTDDGISPTEIDDFFFDEEDYVNTASADNTYDKIGHTDTTSDYLVYYFKDTNTNSTDSITPSWEGQFSQACSGSYPAKLQIYNRNTPAWEDVQSSTTCSADTDFTLSGTISTNLSYYYGTDTYIGTNTVALRVYKQANSSKLIGKTDSFSQNATLFTPPGPTLNQLLRHGGWFSGGTEQPFTF